MPQPRVYISILNWNRPALTLRCLQSLEQLSYDNYHVIVVDNGSRDDSISQIRAVYPQIEIIASSENRGFAGGHHLAKERALADNADLLWLLNNDAFVFPDTLTQLVRAYQTHGDALLGSVVMKMDDDTIIAESAGRDLDEQGNPDPDQHYNPLGGQPLDVNADDRVVTDVNGSSFMVPVSVLRQHGFMREDYFLYGEETDYCFRLRAEGIPSIMVMRSRVTHQLRGSTKDNAGLELVRWYYKRRSEFMLIKRFQPEIYRQQMLDALRQCIKLRLKYALNSEPWSTSKDRYYWLAVRDALLNRTGRQINPDAFI